MHILLSKIRKKFNAFFSSSSFSIYLENCGKSNLNDRIVGGIPASQNEFPWIGIINMAKNIKVPFLCKKYYYLD